MVAVAVIGGLWFAFSVYINWKFGGRYGVNGTYLKCDQDQVTVVIDGVTATLAPGDARIWRFTDRTIEWSCGKGSNFSSSLICREGTEYLLVVRYPDSDELSLQCEILNIPRLRDDPPSDNGTR